MLGQTQATTIDGIRANARSLALWADLMDNGPDDTIAVPMSSILRDLIGEEPPALHPDPDAAIFIACETVRRLRRQRDQTQKALCFEWVSLYGCPTSTTTICRIEGGRNGGWQIGNIDRPALGARGRSGETAGYYAD